MSDPIVARALVNLAETVHKALAKEVPAAVRGYPLDGRRRTQDHVELIRRVRLYASELQLRATDLENIINKIDKEEAEDE